MTTLIEVSKNGKNEVITVATGRRRVITEAIPTIIVFDFSDNPNNPRAEIAAYNSPRLTIRPRSKLVMGNGQRSNASVEVPDDNHLDGQALTQAMEWGNNPQSTNIVGVTLKAPATV